MILKVPTCHFVNLPIPYKSQKSKKYWNKTVAPEYIKIFKIFFILQKKINPNKCKKMSKCWTFLLMPKLAVFDILKFDF